MFLLIRVIIAQGNMVVFCAVVWKYELYRVAKKHQMCFSIKAYVLLTINVRGPNYLGLTRSISWLLIPISNHDIDYVK